MEKFEWENRLLLVFAPGSSDGALADQRKRLALVPDGLAERHMRVIEVLEKRPVTVDETPDTSLSGTSLRKSYEIAPGTFVAVLVGKDGGEKGRWAKPVPPQEVFDMIDVMPMRMDEMREQRN